MRNLIVAAFLLAISFAGGAEDDVFTIVCFGDSTTAFRPGAVEQVYSQRLEKALAGEKSSFRVVNRGVGGDHTERARKRFEADVLSENPDLVVIQFGINDAAVDVWKDPPATGPRISRERFLENLKYFVATLRESGCMVILMTPNPLRWSKKIRELYGKPPYDPDDVLGFEAPFFRDYVEAVRTLAERKGIPLVDIYGVYQNEEAETGRTAEDYLLDGIHPNDKGHELVAGRLLPEIRRIMESRAR